MQSVVSWDSMQPRLLSFLPSRDLGITLHPGSCEVAGVVKDKAAYWAGVHPKWIIALIDGSFVDLTSIQSALAEIRTNKKRKRPWKILFLKPNSVPEVLDERRVRSRPWLGALAMTSFGEMSQGSQERILGSRSLGFRPQQLGAARKAERPVAGNERLVRFCSFNKLGFSLKKGTTTVVSVSNDGLASWEGVCKGWKITDVNGERVSANNVEDKLRDAKEREVYFTVRFLTPSSRALLYKIKKILMEPVSNATINYRLNKPTSMVSQAASARNNKIMDQLLFFGKNESMCEYDGNLEQPKRRWSKEPSMEPIEESVEEGDAFASSSVSYSRERDSGESLSSTTRMSLSDLCKVDSRFRRTDHIRGKMQQLENDEKEFYTV